MRLGTSWVSPLAGGRRTKMDCLNGHICTDSQPTLATQMTMNETVKNSAGKSCSTQREGL